MTPNCQRLTVWGDLACFTRPELKVERFSYPVITPSAARAIFDAIYWKPKFRWQVTRIEVLALPRYIALRRNEMKGRGPSAATVLSWAEGRAEPQPLFADGEEEQTGRTQRQTMALKDVRYRLSAHIVPWPGYESELPAMEAQFRRRAAAGQCIYQPYLGCREFPAFFELCDDDAEKPVPLNLDIGWMLYDVFDLSKPGNPESPARISLFQAKVENGVLAVPDYHSGHVRKPEGGPPND